MRTVGRVWYFSLHAFHAHYQLPLQFFAVFYKYVFRSVTFTIDSNCEHLDPRPIILRIAFSSYTMLATDMFAERTNKAVSL